MNENVNAAGAAAGEEACGANSGVAAEGNAVAPGLVAEFCEIAEIDGAAGSNDAAEINGAVAPVSTGVAESCGAAGADGVAELGGVAEFGAAADAPAKFAAPAAAELEQLISEYLAANWETVVADMDKLIRIPSTEDLSAAEPGKPYGPGPAAALQAALDLSAGMGFDPHNDEGRIGYADFPGQTETQLALICHTDVVPAGPGWNFEPFQITRKDGYLVGRGTTDDKGPLVVALHAMNFWKQLQDQGKCGQFPYTMRFIFGANEETGMNDVAYYRKHHDDPAFLFTPDAEFPVCYGEKGIYNALLISPNLPIDERSVVSFDGGMAVNAVAGTAELIVRADAATLPSAEGITIQPLTGSSIANGAFDISNAEQEAASVDVSIIEAEHMPLARVSAQGKSAHASTPEGGVNAIGMLIDYLLENNLVTSMERIYFEAVAKLMAATDGSALGIACEDEHFGALTAVGGRIFMEDDRFVQTVDVRYPTTTSAEALTARLFELLEPCDGTCRQTLDREPFLIDANGPFVQALLSAYNQATGEEAKPFTMGGGTYAREFSNAASFGPEKPWVEKPAWAGGMHGPDEAASEESLKEAFRIYVLTIAELMQVDL